MAQETSPAFQFYVKEWRSSRAVLRMSFAERGMFLEMLLEQWEHFSLPDDPREVAHIIGGTEAEWIAAWQVLRRKFVDRRAQPRDGASNPSLRRIVNLKLERVRNSLRRFKVIARKGGLARARKAKRSHDGTYSPAVAPAAHQPSASTPTPSPTPTAYREEESTARSKRPIFSGQRLTVFEWQLDDLVKTLGPHLERFDLHDWFFVLDAQAEKAGLVLPKRDGGNWLTQQFVAEAQKRGLPLKMASGPIRDHVAEQRAEGEAALALLKQSRPA